MCNNQKISFQYIPNALIICQCKTKPIKTNANKTSILEKSTQFPILSSNTYPVPSSNVDLIDQSSSIKIIPTTSYNEKLSSTKSDLTSSVELQTTKVESTKIDLTSSLVQSTTTLDSTKADLTSSSLLPTTTLDSTKIDLTSSLVQSTTTLDSTKADLTSSSLLPTTTLDITKVDLTNSVSVPTPTLDSTQVDLTSSLLQPTYSYGKEVKNNLIKQIGKNTNQDKSDSITDSDLFIPMVATGSVLVAASVVIGFIVYKMFCKNNSIIDSDIEME